MAKTSYMPKDDSGKAALFTHIATKLPTHAPVLGIPDTDVEEAKKDAAAFDFVLTVNSQIQSNARQWTGYKDALRDGDAPVMLAYPPLPALPTPTPEAVPAGIMQRMGSLVARIKASRNYSEYIGKDLGIVGAEVVDDFSSWRPVLSSVREAGRPIILWNKGKADALEIWAEREKGAGFSFFAISTDPRFADTTPLLASSAIWSYKGIYRIDDKQIGQWSDIHTTVVGL